MDKTVIAEFKRVIGLPQATRIELLRKRDLLHGLLDRAGAGLDEPLGEQTK